MPQVILTLAMLGAVSYIAYQIWRRLVINVLIKRDIVGRSAQWWIDQMMSCQWWVDHMQAAGVTPDAENLDGFKAALRRAIAEYVFTNGHYPTLSIRHGALSVLLEQAACEANLGDTQRSRLPHNACQVISPDGFLYHFAKPDTRPEKLMSCAADPQEKWGNWATGIWQRCCAVV